MQKLEEDSRHLSMAERLLRAVDRMGRAEEGIALRSMQQNVYQDAALYFEQIATRPSSREIPLARIVLPPRTGKTVVAGKIIERSGLITLYVTTTLDLVRQAYGEFVEKLPGVPVAMLTSENRAELPEHGIMVTTYQMLHALARARNFPEAIRHAGLVFADEAHHAMTEMRSNILRDVFDPLAIRIALTATPDYDEERFLARFFPDLIHEMTITEGVEHDLLARVHAFAVEVDVGAADVRVARGEYEPESLGLVMSRAPLLQATLILRYDEKFRHIPALIVCASRAQARCVQEYLGRHRPKSAPEPALLLGDMDTRVRQTALGAFEAGAIDTLIVVRLLVEGWNSPRCKFEIDLSPSTSWVASAQKFTRVMTKNSAEEAWIAVLQPSNLPRIPVLPVDVFGPGVMEPLETLTRSPTKHGQPAKPRARRARNAWVRLREAGIKIASVRTEAMFGEECRIDQIQLAPDRKSQLTQLMKTAGLYPPALHFSGYSRFLATRFSIAGVSVKGSQLLRVLGFEMRLTGYQAFVMRYFPDDFVDKMLHGVNTWFYARRFNQSPADERAAPIATIPITDMEETFIERLQREVLDEHDGRSQFERYGTVEAGRSAVGSGPVSPEKALVQKRIEAEISRIIDELNPMCANVLRLSFGLGCENPLTQMEIGERYGLSSARISQIKNRSLHILRDRLRHDTGNTNEALEAMTVHRPSRAELAVIKKKLEEARALVFPRLTGRGQVTEVMLEHLTPAQFRCEMDDPTTAPASGKQHVSQGTTWELVRSSDDVQVCLHVVSRDGIFCTPDFMAIRNVTWQNAPEIYYWWRCLIFFVGYRLLPSNSYAKYCVMTGA